MLSVNTSFGLMAGHRSLASARSIVQQAAERLMTGKRINRAGDDPSGLMAVTEMDVQIETLKKDIKALGDREAVLGAQEGALSVMNDLLIELEGLVVTAANRGAMSGEEREGLQVQADSILEALDNTWIGARFKGERLFEGLYTTTAGVVSYGEDEPGDSLDDLTGDGGLRAALGALASGKALNLMDGDLEGAQESVESALSAIVAWRGGIGNQIKNDIEPRRNAMLSELENITQAKSDIEDADIAAEMSNLIRGQILEQASIYSILVARQTPHAALKLLETSVQIAKNQ